MSLDFELIETWPMEQQARFILDFLIIKSGKKFRHVEANLRLIRARLKEGYSEHDIRMVTMRYIFKWKDTDMHDYIRPKTLYNATNFAQYVVEIGQPLRKF
jgi:uncharacterized phage protein (TIGR02220 family)